MLLLTGPTGRYDHGVLGDNLDMALSEDFDGGDQLEVLAPDQGLTVLGDITRVQEGAQLDWHLQVCGTISTDLAAIAYSDGIIELVAVELMGVTTVD